METNKEDIEVTILVNDYSQINLYYINELISNIKRIYIITNNIRKFKVFADKLYKEEAITVPVMNNKNKSFSRDEILNSVWGDDYFGSDRVVDDLIRRLRKKMKKLNVNTVYGYGYRLS